MLDTLNPDERRPWSTAAPRDARHAPLRAVPGPPTHHLNDPLLFEECGDEDDRRRESVL